MARSIPTPSHAAHRAAWVAACLILAAPFLDAGPHHFWKWTSGVITSVNAAAQEFIMTDSSNCIPVRWTAETLLWTAAERAGGKLVEPKFISTGRVAKVLGPVADKTYVAERIILDSTRR